MVDNFNIFFSTLFGFAAKGALILIATKNTLGVCDKKKHYKQRYVYLISSSYLLLYDNCFRRTMYENSNESSQALECWFCNQRVYLEEISVGCL